MQQKILIIDDDVAIIDLLTASLEDNYTLFTALNGKEALALLANIEIPHLIICDVVMNEMNGFQFKEVLNLSSHYKKIPFLFMSAYTETERQVNGFNLGAYAYITKPINEEVLKAHVKALLNNCSEKSDSLSLIALKNIRYEQLLKYGITSKEFNILLLLIEGYQIKEIADKLNISEGTAKNYISKSYKKLFANNRTELIFKLLSMYNSLG